MIVIKNFALELNHRQLRERDLLLAKIEEHLARQRTESMMMVEFRFHRFD